MAIDNGGITLGEFGIKSTSDNRVKPDPQLLKSALVDLSKDLKNSHLAQALSKMVKLPSDDNGNEFIARMKFRQVSDGCSSGEPLNLPLPAIEISLECTGQEGAVFSSDAPNAVQRKYKLSFLFSPDYNSNKIGENSFDTKISSIDYSNVSPATDGLRIKYLSGAHTQTDAPSHFFDCKNIAGEDDLLQTLHKFIDDEVGRFSPNLHDMAIEIINHEYDIGKPRGNIYSEFTCDLT